MDLNSQKIAIVIEHPNDILLAQQLLRGINHDLSVYNAQDSHDQLLVKNLQTDIVIVFHRAIRNSSNSTVSDPCLPDSKPKRLIILSDCHREDAVVRTLNAGAHHYFDINEKSFVLKVRVEAALRTHQHAAMNILDVAPFKFNVERRKVTCNGKAIHLSPREFSLAYFLFSNHDRIVFDSELMVSIWTLPSSMDSRRIDTAICRIRKKMNLYEGSAEWSLQRLRQIGYQLVNHASYRVPLQNQPKPLQNQPKPLQNQPQPALKKQPAAEEEQSVVSISQTTSSKPTYAIAG